MEEGELRLNHDEIQHVVELASRLSDTESPNVFCNRVKELTALLPHRILLTLQQFAKTGSKTGFLLIRSIPIDETTLPDTPPNNTYRVGRATPLAKIQALFMSVISDLISYEAECDGALFQDVVPTKSMAQLQTSMGSAELEIHTEQAFSKLRPDFLSLSCLRGDPEAKTYIMPVQSILQNVSNEEQGWLREPLWYSGVDVSFKLNGQEFLEGDVRGPMSILSADLEDPHLVFDQDLMYGVTEDSQHMIDKIVDIYYKERLTHVFVPGDIVIIDNRRSVHGRSTYHPKYDGKDRFLIRCFGIIDMKRTEYARPSESRMIAAKYS
jgi:L-asparagine oxygenase